MDILTDRLYTQDEIDGMRPIMEAMNRDEFLALLGMKVDTEIGKQNILAIHKTYKPLLFMKMMAASNAPIPVKTVPARMDELEVVQ